MSHPNFRRNRLRLQAFCPQFMNPGLLLGRHRAPLRRDAGLAQNHPDRVVADAVFFGECDEACTARHVRRNDSLPICVIDSANQSATRGPSRERNRFTVP